MYTNIITMKRPSNHLNNDFENLTENSLKHFETFISVYDNFSQKLKYGLKPKTFTVLG